MSGNKTSLTHLCLFSSFPLAVIICFESGSQILRSLLWINQHYLIKSIIHRLLYLKWQPHTINPQNGQFSKVYVMIIMDFPTIHSQSKVSRHRCNGLTALAWIREASPILNLIGNYHNNCLEHHYKDQLQVSLFVHSLEVKHSNRI